MTGLFDIRVVYQQGIVLGNAAVNETMDAAPPGIRFGSAAPQSGIDQPSVAGAMPIRARRNGTTASLTACG
jgi:hypothetical protein